MLRNCGLARDKVSIDVHQAFVLTALAWIVITLFAALPLSVSSVAISYTDAYFEAMSGVTGTGATVLVGIEHLPVGILWWRTILIWFGGVGIIVMAVAVLPFLRIGGMQLFQTESSDKSDKIVAKAFDLAIWIFAIFVALTLLCASLYKAFGMIWFDAFNHALTTISTGGFSTHDSSFGHFSSHENYRAMVWTATIFMVAGALPFVAFIRLARGKVRDFFGDIQLRSFAIFLVAVIVLIAVTRTVRADVDFGESLTHAAFNIVSIVTTTGFARGLSALGAVRGRRLFHSDLCRRLFRIDGGRGEDIPLSNSRTTRCRAPRSHCVAEPDQPGPLS